MGRRSFPVTAVALLVAVAAAACSPPAPDRGIPAPGDRSTTPPGLPPADVEGIHLASLAAGADSERVGGPVVSLGHVSASPHPVIAAIGFKSVQRTVVYLDRLEGAGGTWREVFEPERDMSGGFSLWIGEGVTGGEVTATFSGPLELGRLGWTFDAAAGIDPADPFVQIATSPWTDATSKEAVLSSPPSEPVYGFVIVGRGGGVGAPEPENEMRLLGRGQGPVINVASQWSPEPVKRVAASWEMLASNVVIAAELRPA